MFFMALWEDGSGGEPEPGISREHSRTRQSADVNRPVEKHVEVIEIQIEFGNFERAFGGPQPSGSCVLKPMF